VLALEGLEDRTLLATWAALGPAPLANGQTSGNLPVSGRITGVAADPADANTLFIATAGGGVWKTTDGGATWNPLTDHLTSGGAPLPQFMGAIAETRDSANNQVVYAGMGEANNSGDSFYGDGILVSRDGGTTWTLTNAAGALTGQTVSKIVLDPSDASGGTAYAAVAIFGVNGPGVATAGIWKTTDFGAHWTNTTATLPNNPTYNSWSDLVIDPGSPNILFAAEGNPFNNFGYATGNGVYETTNAGASWTLLRGTPTGTQDGRIALALYDANGTFELFVAIAVPSNLSNGAQLYKMFKSTDRGASFTDLTATVPNYLGQNGLGQGDYDTTLAVSPTNPNFVFAGGSDNGGSPGDIKSTNGGVSWVSIVTDGNGKGPHTDSHATAFDANGNLLEGDDGGLFRYNPSTNLWSSLNGNLNTIEFNGIATDPTNANVAYGGSQDNGTSKYNGAQGWTQLIGGDGGLTRLDPTNHNRVYQEFYGASLQRSDDGGAHFTNVTAGLSGRILDYAYPSPFALDSAGTILYGTDWLSRSTNQGSSWSVIGKNGLNGFNPGDNLIDAVAVAPSNNAVVYVESGGHLFVTQNATSANASGVIWTAIDLPGGAEGGFGLNSLVVDPNNPGTAYEGINFFTTGSGGLVYKTTNFGSSWTDVSKNLLNSPVWALALSADGSTVYAGTDVGLYATSNSGSTWSVFGTGLPNVQVTDLEVVPSLNLLAAGTYGRGLWVISTAPAPTVSGVSPTSGPAAGGTTVLITGTGFTGATAVQFGNVSASSFTVNSDTQISAVSPAQAAGTVDVTVANPNGTSAVGSADRFTYVAAPTVTSISPNSGPAAGGTTVTITGTGFTATSTVKFGSVAASSVTFVSATSLTAVSPAKAAGIVDVTVTTVGGTSASGSPDQYTYLAAPTVTGVAPGSGPAAGGTSVMITGTGFTGATVVKFDGVAAAGFTVNSDTQITAVSPAEAAGTVDITVTTVGGTSAIGAADHFTFVAAPSVTGLSPTSGGTAGGLSVTISGTGFTGATAVRFGSVAATSFTVNSDTSLTAVTPAEAAGTVDVTVTTVGGTSATGSADRFTFSATTVTGVSPNNGGIGGGLTVTITGVGFTGATAVLFGSVAAASFTISSDTQILATTPAESAGTVDVLVTSPSGASAPGSGDQFTFVTPAVTGINPTSGSTGGGLTVRITGIGFTGTTAVLFGTASATSYTVISDTQITAVTPAEPAGTVDVTVTTPGGTTAAGSTDRFTFVTPAVTGINPSSGPTAGGTSVTITGVGFTGATAVLFGTVNGASFTVNSDTQITAISPAEAPGTVDVTVITPGGTTATSASDQFTFVVAPTVTGLSPSSGPTAGGTIVTITGTGFTRTTLVNFDGVAAASFTVNSDTQITAVSPAHAAATVDVTVTTPGGTTTTGAADRFTYVAAPTVTAVNPSSGPPAGGATVTITGTGFTGATAVQFGGVNAASFTVSSDTQITAVTPAHAAGTVDVTVTTVGGTSATGSADRYTFADVPIVTGISPTQGPTAGGTAVTITGIGFTRTTAVQFDGVQATSFTVNSDTQITAVSPAEPAGTVDVTVTTGGGTSATGAADRFTYVAAPTVTAVSPTSGPTTGGATVTITGTGFTGATAVQFGGVNAASFTVVSDTQISAVTPAHAAGTVDVTVTTGGGTSATGSADRYTFVAAPTITSLFPTNGSTSGGTIVTIFGTGFTGATALLFGTVAASSFTVLGDNLITAITPAHDPGTVDVTVTTAGGTSAISAADKFTFNDPSLHRTRIGTVTGVASLTALAGTLTDGAGNPVNEFPPAPGAASSLGGDTSIVIVETTPRKGGNDYVVVHRTDVATAYRAQNDGNLFADIDGDLLVDTADPRIIRPNSRKTLP
jgi:hypothetical protein